MIEIFVKNIDGKFILYSRSHKMENIAGPRLFGKDWPNIEFEHTNEKKAERDAAILQKHCNERGK